MQSDLQFLRTRANFIRYSYIEEMEKHLLAFESKMFSKNITVKWVGEETELVDFICKSLPKTNYNKVCFDVPVISEAFFQKKNFIKQISIDAVEKNDDNAENLIIQADFGIVENGALVLIDKQSKNCFNNVEKLFIILNINNLIVRLNDLDILLFLKGGMNNPQYFSDIKILNNAPTRIISKKFQSSEEKKYSSEQVEVIVLLYDNGITEVLEDNILRETLYCIHCGKCKEVCPVFQQTGEFAPIELIKLSCKEENKRNPKLFESTSLCGNCTENCPVQINFTQLFIHQMKYLAKRNSNHEKNIDLFKVLSKRSKMNKKNSKMRRYFFVKKYFGKNKKLANYFSNCSGDFFNLSQKETQ